MPRLKINDFQAPMINILDPITEQFIFNMIIIPVTLDDVGLQQRIDASVSLDRL